MLAKHQGWRWGRACIGFIEIWDRQRLVARLDQS
jgi:hypothetical protein